MARIAMEFGATAAAVAGAAALSYLANRAHLARREQQAEPT